MADDATQETFDEVDWTRRLLELNPWIAEAGLAPPTRRDWDPLRGHDVSDAFVDARRRACRARREAGTAAWNLWAEGMAKLREELVAAERWRIQSIKRPTEIGYVHLQRGGRDETVAYIAASRADFSAVRFEDEADFREWRFPNIVSFKGTTFAARAVFGGALFHRSAEFEGCAFEKEAIFSGAAFHAGARFGEATFHDIALFAGTRFRSSANFRGAVFHGQARFATADFAGVAGFSAATFKQEALFGGVAFEERIVFNETRFEARADFGRARFNRRATFTQARFEGTAAFSGAAFTAVADFNGAAFHHEAEFEKATFSDTATFRGAGFHRRATIEDAAFKGWTNFNDAAFHHRFVARRAAFDADASFAGGVFETSCDFRGARFAQRLDFVRAQFFGVTTFAGAAFDGNATFEAVQGKEGSSLSLADCVFGRVPNFIQAHFQEAPRLDNVRIAPKRRGGVFSIDRDPDRAARWRNLKRLAIQGHDHQRELDFFAGEIMAQRFVVNFPLPGRWKRPWKRAWRPLWPGGARYWFGLVFGLFSNFGRSMFRPLAWWVAFTLLFGAVNLNQHFEERAALGLEGPTRISEWVSAGFPALGCVAGRGEAASEALYLSAARGLVFTGLVGGARTPQTYACLYGVNGADAAGVVLPQQFTPIVPPEISYYATVQLLLSILLITLLLLALRNHFRIR